MSFRNLSLAWMACAALASGMGGCLVTEEDNGPPTGPSFAYPTVEDFCAGLAAAECGDEVVQACYGSDAASLEANRETCAGVRAAACSANTLEYHPEFAEACVNARRTALTNASLTRDEIGATDEACVAVFSAGGADGTACVVHTDCDTGAGLRCVMKPGAPEGLCKTPREVGGGSACEEPDAVCAEGFYCESMSLACLEQPATGGDCSTAEPCAAGFKCTAPNSGVCVEQEATGGPCLTGGDCASGFCLIPSGGAMGTCSATWMLQQTATTCDEFRPATSAN